jgi:di/tricarboxylate transporter
VRCLTGGRSNYWRLGAIFGVIYIAVLLLIGLPWLAIVG